MKITALVTAEETREGNKNGKDWKMTTVTLQDMGDKPRCKTPIEITLGDDDADLIGTLEGQTIVVNILSLESGYKGSIRANGKIERETATPETTGSSSRRGRGEHAGAGAPGASS